MAGVQPFKNKGPSDKNSEKLDAGFHKATQNYHDTVKFGTCEGPFLVLEDVPVHAFKDWVLQRESTWQLGFVHTDSVLGSVWLYGDPSKIHEHASQFFTTAMERQLSSWLGGHTSYYYLIRYTGSTCVNLKKANNGKDVQKEPDWSCEPHSAKVHACPVVVAEIAFRNETLKRLRDELNWWTTDDHAEVAYGVKIDISGAKMLNINLQFLEKRRGSSDIKEIDFSPPFCTCPNQAGFVIRLKFDVIVKSLDNLSSRITYAIPSDIMDKEFVFDLYDLQQCIVELACNEMEVAEDNPKLQDESTSGDNPQKVDDETLLDHHKKKRGASTLNKIFNVYRGKHKKH